MSSSPTSFFQRLRSAFGFNSSAAAEPTPIAAEPLPPAPLVPPNPEVISLPKGLGTEMRKAVDPDSTVGGEHPPIPPASRSSFPASTIRVMRRMMRLPGDIFHGMKKASPKGHSSAAAPQPKSIPPSTRFEGKDFPIV